MQPLLGRQPLAPSRAAAVRGRVVSAAAAVLAVCVASVYGIVQAERALHATPAAAPLLALAAAATLGAVLPLIVYCGAAGEFEAGFHPLTPRGYAALAARTYGAAHAARGAGGRVEGKDL